MRPFHSFHKMADDIHFSPQYLHEPEHLYFTYLQQEHTHRNYTIHARIVLFLGKSYLQKQE